MSHRKPPPLPKEGSARATGDASRSQEPFFQTRQTESSDASVPPGQDALSRAVSLEAARTYFQDEARLILSAERGLTPRAQGMLEGVAQRYGLSAEEADNALAALMPPTADRESTVKPSPDVSVVPTPPPPPDAAVRSQPTTGPPETLAPPTLPSDVPQAPPLSLAETFGQYVREALSRSSRSSLSERKERKLVDEGVEKLRLSRSLARQIVHHVATARSMSVDSLKKEPRDETAEAILADPERWEAFRARAAAILAEQRGVNARSRMMLEAAAAEIGLPADQIDSAIASLKPVDEASRSRQRYELERLDEFRSYLEDAFQRLAQGPVTSGMQQRWETVARDRFGIGAEQACQAIRRVAADMNVRVVSERQAEEHLVGLLRKSLRETDTAREHLSERLLQEGRQWGLGPDQVEALIDDELRRRRRWRRIRRGLIWSLPAVLLLCGALVLTLVSGRKSSKEDKSAAAAFDEQGPGNEAAPSIDAPTGSEWWARDVELLAAVTRLRARLPAMKKWLQGLNVADADSRARAHREMVAAAAKHARDERNRDLLATLIASCFASEPSDACAEALSQSLLELIPHDGTALPQNMDGFEDAFWAAETIAAALAHPNLSPTRRDAMTSSVRPVLERSIDFADPTAIREQVLRGLAQKLLFFVAAGVAKEPRDALPLFLSLVGRAGPYLDASTIERASVELLASALPAIGTGWQEYRPLIDAIIGSEDPLVVLRIADLLDQVTETELQGYLAERLLRRVGESPRGLSPRSVARRVREALGATLPVSGQDRWRQLRGFAEEALQYGETGLSSEELLQQTVDLARLATLATALARGEVGAAAYQELLLQGEFKLVSPQADSPDESATSTTRPSSSQARRLRQAVEFIRYLNNSRSRPVQRMLMLRNLASVASDLPNIPEDSARLLAEYLMSAKSDDEHRQVLEMVPAVTRWYQVRLAMADEVLDTAVHRERVEPVVASALRNPGLLRGNDPWKPEAYRALVQDVLVQVRDEISLQQQQPLLVYDDAREFLRELYNVQAHLAGVPAERYANVDTVAQVLRLMIDVLARRVNATEFSGGASVRGEGLSHRLIAADSIAGDDFQRTVRLQRIWLRLVALHVATEQPGKAAAIDMYLARLQASDRSAEDSIQQLRDGEATLLRIWLLASPDA